MGVVTMDQGSERLIQNNQQIVQILLEQGLLGEHLEVQVNRGTGIFTSRLVPWPSDTEIGEDNTAPRRRNEPSEPFDYLRRHRFILMEGLLPEGGNDELCRPGEDRMTISFFSGNNALETMVTFEQLVERPDRPPIIRASFPEEMRALRTRKYIRSVALVDSEVSLKVVACGGPELSARIHEMSPGGLSFWSSHPSEVLPIGREVVLRLFLPDEPPLELNAYVRNYNLIPGQRSDIRTGTAIIGVIFANLDSVKQMRATEYINFIQREYLLRTVEILARTNQLLESKVRENRSKSRELEAKDVELIEMDRVASAGTLALGLAHGLNVPMGSVKETLESLRGMVETGNQNPKELMAKYDAIEREVDKATQIAEGLRGFAWETETYSGKADVNENVGRAIQMISTIKPAGVEIQSDLAPLPPVACPPSELWQCLLHTLKNALDAVGDTGSIQVATIHDVEKEQIRIRIVDNGRGMSPDTVARATDPFFSANAAELSTGMGLTFTERILRGLNGSIELASKEGEGTTATLSLPVRRLPTATG